VAESFYTDIDLQTEHEVLTHIFNVLAQHYGYYPQISVDEFFSESKITQMRAQTCLNLIKIVKRS
jgi:hypothetical protein